MATLKTGYATALKTILDTTPLPAVQTVPLQYGIGRIAAENIYASVNAPSADSSLMDGYAVSLSNLTDNDQQDQVLLRLDGNSAAGQETVRPVLPGNAMRILTGGRIPEGADAVIAEEDTQVSDGQISVNIPVEKGQHILRQGHDIRIGALIVSQGKVLTPGDIGYLTTGGAQKIKVFQPPKVAIIATGDEILLPGQPLTPGKLYASNMLTSHSWCRYYGMDTSLKICKDHPDDLEKCLQQAAQNHDAVITSGGAWTGDRDLTAKCLEKLGWEQYFHRLRLGPGKAAGFGLLNRTPVFILPGGPPSNLVGFLGLALPGLLKMSGFQNHSLPQIPVTLAAAVKSRSDWTHAEFGGLETTDRGILFNPIPKRGSRLKSIASAQALMMIPEGISQVHNGEAAMAYDLRIHSAALVTMDRTDD